MYDVKTKRYVEYVVAGEAAGWEWRVCVNNLCLKNCKSHEKNGNGYVSSVCSVCLAVVVPGLLKRARIARM